MNAFNTGKLQVIKISKRSETENRREKMTRRNGMQQNYFPSTEPVIVSPYGPRFSIKGGKVTYFNWQFNYLLRSTYGLGLFDIRHKGVRIAYEISLQEAASYYSTGGPQRTSTSYLDSLYHLGKSTSLIKGNDCPKHAIYLDATLYYGKPNYVKDALCVFEQNPSVPLRRHHHSTSSESFIYGGMNDASLVVRHMIEMWNYDYSIDYVLHQNGAIEVKTITTGHLLLSPYYSQNQSMYGYEVTKNYMGALHDHIMLYKVDLDIHGTKNSFKTIDMITKTFADPWDQFPLVKKYLRHNKRKSEKNATVRYNFDEPKYYVIYNEDRKNIYGNVRGYQINIPYKVKQVYPDDHPSTRAIEWSKYQISVSRFKEGERFGAYPYNFNPSYINPPCSFDKRFEDDENIEQKDVVAWIPVDGLHIPCVEDYPTTGTVGNQFSFFIKPFNYFDDDPSFGSRDSVYIEKDSNGIKVEAAEENVDERTCGIPRKTF